jgi:hypothetical protein
MPSQKYSFHQDYAVDCFDPRTWHRGVFGEGTMNTDVGIGGDSGLSPHPVHRHMNLAPSVPQADDEIRQEVAEVLFRDRRLAPAQIAVAVNDGVITLRGRIESRVQRFISEERLLAIRGVRGIENLVEIKRGLFEPFAGYHWI